MKIEKNTIDGFFNNSLSTDIDRSFKEAIISDTIKDKENNEDLLQTNILYLTTDCNIDCEYCYQKDDRANSPKKVITKQEITEYF